MSRYIDLSGKLENKMWSYSILPGLEKLIPPVSIKTIATIKNDGFFASMISIPSVSGTYVEASSHIIDNGKLIENYSIEDFIKPAIVIKLPEQKPKAIINLELILEHLNKDLTFENIALIIDTGWWKNWNKRGYVLDCPNYSRDTIEWIVSKRIKMLCVDVPCIESSWSENNKNEKGSLLELLFRNNILLVAPVVNLDKISQNQGTIFAIPLPVANSSGSPARVFFKEED